MKRHYFLIILFSINHVSIHANIITALYGYFISLHELLKWNLDSVYQKKKTAEVVHLAAEQARARSLLYKLNMIQLNDINLSEEALAPLNSIINKFCGESDGKPQPNFRSKDQISIEMQQNLKLFDKLIPNLRNLKTNDDYRYIIVTTKNQLKKQICNREGKEYSPKINCIFGKMFPSKGFIKELTWHKTRAAEIKIKRFHPILLNYSNQEMQYLS